MKLTNTMRDAFVRAAMDDVPTTDFSEQRAKVLQDEARERLPVKVRAIFDDKELRAYIGTKYVHGSCVYAAPDYEPTAATLKKIESIRAKEKAQSQRNSELRQKLRAVAYSVSTRKALADSLPEFSKYLPADEPAAIRTVPAIRDVMTDFVKAGWPKDKTPAPAKGARVRA
jgi:hypothetical protein